MLSAFPCGFLWLSVLTLWHLDFLESNSCRFNNRVLKLPLTAMVYFAQERFRFGVLVVQSLQLTSIYKDE